MVGYGFMDSIAQVVRSPKWSVTSKLSVWFTALYVLSPGQYRLTFQAPIVFGEYSMHMSMMNP